MVIDSSGLIFASWSTWKNVGLKSRELHFRWLITDLWRHKVGTSVFGLTDLIMTSYVSVERKWFTDQEKLSQSIWRHDDVIIEENKYLRKDCSCCKAGCDWGSCVSAVSQFWSRIRRSSACLSFSLKNFFGGNAGILDDCRLSSSASLGHV